MWRWPEEWDNRPPPPPMSEHSKLWALRWEYGPTREEWERQERFRQEKFPWFDGHVHVERPRHVDALWPEEVKPGDVVHAPLQLKDQEEKGSGIRVLVQRGIEECVVPAEGGGGPPCGPSCLIPSLRVAQWRAQTCIGSSRTLPRAESGEHGSACAAV
jgi:hypothetical protein